MKKCCFLLILLAIIGGLLCACGNTAQHPMIRVSLVETGDFYLEENGIQIYPGQNVTFTLQMASGTELEAIDYDGQYYIWKENGMTKVELRNVRFPTRVTPEVTRYFRSITYDANGGTGEIGTVTYSTSIHTRPNTAIGTDTLSREGYTLTSWNTQPDGSGTRIGLGSRVTVPEAGLILYAQWSPWSSEGDFLWTVSDDGVKITGYIGAADQAVIPERISGHPVTVIGAGAFADSAVTSVILPPSLVAVEEGAFNSSALETLLLFDNIETVSDAAFAGCDQLTTLYINAVEAPYGYLFRRESMYADKIDLMIDAQGQKKVVFYSGCSMWYNLNGEKAQTALQDYTVINAAINGTVNSYVQMQIMGHFLEEGDIFFHAPELSSPQQLMVVTDMGHNDDKLWCGLENNYDLFALVDIRGIGGVFDTFCAYLSKKTEEATYRQQYVDDKGNVYMDDTGSLPFLRTEPLEEIRETDLVVLDLQQIEDMRQSPLGDLYRSYADKGVAVYVSYGCVDRTALTEEEDANISAADKLFRQVLEEMEAPILVSTLWDYLYDESQFYDSAFHLLSPTVDNNTATWLRDLRKQMGKDGL